MKKYFKIKLFKKYDFNNPASELFQVRYSIAKHVNYLGLFDLSKHISLSEIVNIAQIDISK